MKEAIHPGDYNYRRIRRLVELTRFESNSQFNTQELIHVRTSEND